MLFEEALSNPIPLAEAADYFLRLKTAGALKVANMGPLDPAPLPPASKGQNPIQPSTAPLPAAAQGQHQKLALALKGFTPAERGAVSLGLGRLEQGLGKKSVGVLRQAAPDLKALAERPSVTRMKAAAAMKLALGEMGIDPSVVPAPQQVAVPQAPPSPMQGYMAEEQAGAAGQEQNELVFYRQKMQEAVAELDAQRAQSEQTGAQVAQLEQQVQQSQGQQEQYQQMVSSATQQASAARDETLREQQASAAMRMAYQQLRGQLLNVASQEPPSTEMLAEQAAMAPAAGAVPDPNAQPGAPAPGGEQAGQPPGQEAQPQEPAPQAAAPEAAAPAAESPAQPAAPKPAAPKPAAPKPAVAKTAGVGEELMKRVPYALGGAALGAGAEMAYKAKSSDPLKKKVERLEGAPTGSFGQAFDLAQAKARLALANAVDAHPRGALAAGMLAGGIEGALGGPEIGRHFGQGMKDLKKLNH